MKNEMTADRGQNELTWLPAQAGRRRATRRLALLTPVGRTRAAVRRYCTCAQVADCSLRS